MKSLLFILFALLVRTTSLAGDFKVVAEITVETEPGIKRFNANKNLNPMLDAKITIKHSAETKPGKATIQFLTYADGKRSSYTKLLKDLDKNKYRAATIQELCSVQKAVKGVAPKLLNCFGTQVYLDGLPGLEYAGIYEVNITNDSGPKMYYSSDSMFDPGFIIAAVKLTK